MTTLNDVLHHALTDIKRYRKAAEESRIAAYLDALIAQIEAIIEDLEAGPNYATKVIVKTAPEVEDQQPTVD